MLSYLTKACINIHYRAVCLPSQRSCLVQAELGGVRFCVPAMEIAAWCLASRQKAIKRPTCIMLSCIFHDYTNSVMFVCQSQFVVLNFR